MTTIEVVPIPNFRVYWANANDSGCHTCQAPDIKGALTEAIQSGINSLDWTQCWQDCGDHWLVTDLCDPQADKQRLQKHEKDSSARSSV